MMLLHPHREKFRGSRRGTSGEVCWGKFREIVGSPGTFQKARGSLTPSDTLQNCLQLGFPICRFRMSPVPSPPSYYRQVFILADVSDIFYFFFCFRRGGKGGGVRGETEGLGGCLREGRGGAIFFFGAGSPTELFLKSKSTEMDVNPQGIDQKSRSIPGFFKGKSAHQNNRNNPTGDFDQKECFQQCAN